MNETDFKAESVLLEMATVLNDIPASTAIKPPRLGRAPAFGSGFGNGISGRTYIATACLQGRLAAIDDTDGDMTFENFAKLAVQQADALLAELAK